MSGAQQQRWGLSAVVPTAKKQSIVRPTANKLLFEDRAAHDWYRFVLSYPPHLVRDYLTKFGVGRRDLVLDPFCGTGTTVVECKKQGIRSVGFEANPVAHFAASTKTQWGVDADQLTSAAKRTARAAESEIGTSLGSAADLPLFAKSANHEKPHLRKLSGELEKLILKNSICPLPLHKSLILIDHLRKAAPTVREHMLLAMAKALVTTISNLHFGPEVGVRGRKEDVDVVGAWLAEVGVVAEDLRNLAGRDEVPARVHLADARSASVYLKPNSVSAVITSPPYPNEKDYSRTTRLEGVLLNFIRSKDELRAMKKTLVRSNTRSVYVADDDDKWIEDIPEVAHVADEIEQRRIEMGKTSGFERQYHRVTRLYFGGMARHLAELRKVLKPGAQLAYVVGDQASYLRVMIRTGQLLAQIAEKLGYDVETIDLFRTRLATATKEQLREEVVVLRWPNTSRS